jgi:signal peptidase II
VLLIPVVLIVITIDQLSKFLVQNTMAQMQSIPIIPHIFHITYVQNPGAAFSLLADQTVLFIIITVFAVIFSLVFYQKISKEKIVLRFAVALLLGGAIGNLIDRIRIGQVIDFFDFRIWPVFNIADCAIVIGAVLICWELLKSGLTEHKEQKTE